MSAATRGVAFERKVRRVLEALGYLVIRAAGSQGPADLVALRARTSGGSDVLLVQSKLSGQLGPRERAELDELARAAGAAWLLALNIGSRSRHVVGFTRHDGERWEDVYLEGFADGAPEA